MVTSKIDKERRIRAYFSHSYRSEDDDKRRNLFFWELFSEQGCYFTVDQKPYPKSPMDVTYLEWLMRRSDCFIAVIPKRYEKNAPDGCSPYQSFENGLAVRANKPRLIFVEDGLPEHLFVGSKDEICFFHPKRYKEQEVLFREKAYKLLDKARTTHSSIPGPRKPIALITEKRNGYTEDVFRSIKQVVKQGGYELEKIINSSQILDKDWSFVLDIEKYEILISEIRWPYVALDTLASAHQRFIPMIRICYLDGDESEEQITQKMNLSTQEEEWVEDSSGKITTLLRGYKLDSEMHPVIFWHNLGELIDGIASHLSKTKTDPRSHELLKFSDAKRYFLSIGMQSEKIFISNANSANYLGIELAKLLFDEGINRFHYMDFNAIPVGTPDWVQAVKKAIDESKIFVALINKDYEKSENCLMELEHALERYDMEIHPYLVEDMDWPKKLKLIQGKNLTLSPKEQWMELITTPIRNRLVPKDDSINDEDITTTQSDGGNALSQQQGIPNSNYENAVFVSYAWGGDSERIVDELERAFFKRGIRIIRDKKDIGYKGSIEAFEQRVGQGQCIVIVISDKYLRSEHCMYELMVADKNRSLRERIFPIVLADAQIYKVLDRVDYIQYWDKQTEQLNQKIKQVDKMTNLPGIMANLDKYAHIRASFDHLTDLLSDMNALTPELHAANDFSTLISSVEAAMTEKKNVSTTKSSAAKSDEISENKS